MRALRIWRLLLALPVAFGIAAGRSRSAEAAEKSAPAANSAGVDFQKQIGPLLSQRCLSCHNPNQFSGKLDLSTAKTALAGGESGPVIVPGKPDDSPILDRITAPDGGRPDMPKEGTPLDGKQVALVRTWIEHGAAWPADARLTPAAKADLSWWSLQPLAVSQPPDPAGIPADWARNPIDRFVYAKLAEKHLRPAPADRRTLIRRATYDLLGLPPTPEEVAAFLADARPDAYERLVDRLLASPHYGEHWGRHWLDVARFGESNGYEVNSLRDNAWPYRDYVVRALNDDKPFDRFALEQLAGDQVAPGNPSVEAATGFLVAGPVDLVGNQDPAATAVIRANTLDDIITATGAGFLGLTINCCRCHDHKFDPIRQADYYRMYATFAGVVHGSRTWAPAAEQKQWEAKQAALVGPRDELNRQLAEQDAAIKARVAARRTDFMKRYTRPKVNKHGTEETFPPTPARYVRLEATLLTNADEREPSGLGLNACQVYSAAEPKRNLALLSLGAKATARLTRASYINKSFYSPEHLIDGQATRFWLCGEDGTGQFTIELPRVETIGRVRWSSGENAIFWQFPEEYTISVSLDGKKWTKVADSAGRLPYDDYRLEELLRQAVLDPPQRAKRVAAIARRDDLNRQLKSLKPLPTAWLGEFHQPKGRAYVMLGGNPQRHGQSVTAGSWSTLARVAPGYSLPADAPEGARRVALAHWITDAKNPLTPRVWVNRIWQYHFGRGIVGTPSDFGFNGARPTHPELLDWLARQAHENGWHWKPLHRLIMTSQAYRQSSRFDAAAARVDGDAAFLWRFPPRRLAAEEVRDSILSIAGKLDLRIGGPGFRLFKYVQDNVSIYTPLDDPGPSTYRRSLYHENAQASRVDVLTDFDLPDCSLAVPKHDATTSPLQALTMLNNRFIADMSRALAERLQREVGQLDRAAQIDRAYRLAFGRPPEKAEVQSARELIDRHGLSIFCRALFNTEELLYVY